MCLRVKGFPHPFFFSQQTSVKQHLCANSYASQGEYTSKFSGEDR